MEFHCGEPYLCTKCDFPCCPRGKLLGREAFPGDAPQWHTPLNGSAHFPKCFIPTVFTQGHLCPPRGCLAVPQHPLRAPRMQAPHSAPALQLARWLGESQGVRSSKFTSLAPPLTGCVRGKKLAFLALFCSSVKCVPYYICKILAPRWLNGLSDITQEKHLTQSLPRRE